MKPLNSRYFGNLAGRIKVTFTLVGGGTATGWIVKQIGGHRFRVSNGTETRNCYLAQTTAKAGTLGDEAMTITVTKHDGSVENVRRIHSKKLLTTQGSVLLWRTDATQSSAEGRIDTI